MSQISQATDTKTGGPLINNETTATGGHEVGGSSAGVIIEAEGVYKTSDSGRVQVAALRGVDLQVTRGEMVAIMGPSGCGKTTLLNCLSGLDEIDSGSISIGGSDLVRMKDNEKTRYRATRMGYVFQSYNLLPVLTVLENAELPLLVSPHQGGPS